MSIAFQEPVTQQPSGLGFPPCTPLSEMTDAERAAYWRHEAKKQQALLRNALRDISEIVNGIPI
jgi:hypothetical protein